MRRTHVLGVALLLVALIVAIGFGRGWFRLSSDEDTARDTAHVNLAVDRAKIRDDTQKAVEKTDEEATRISESVRRGASNLKERVHDKVTR